jgi:hypothetical protein
MNKVDIMIETVEDNSVTVESYKTYEPYTNGKTNGNGSNGNGSLKKAEQNNTEDSGLNEKSFDDIVSKRIKFRTEVLGFSKEDAEEWTKENVEKMQEIRVKMRTVDFSVIK